MLAASPVEVEHIVASAYLSSRIPTFLYITIYIGTHGPSDSKPESDQNRPGKLIRALVAMQLWILRRTA